MTRRPFRIAALGLAAQFASAQAPLLQDGAVALRQARLDWTLGQTPLGPSSLPSFEVGWGGAGSDGSYTPLTDAEGLGHGTRGWGLGLQGRYVRDGYSFSATALALRDHGHTLGVLQRAALAYLAESGWRVALEQAPFAWGSGLNGGDLLGDSARGFARLSLTTPAIGLLGVLWRAEAFTGRLEEGRPVPDWSADRKARITAQAAGLDLRGPDLRGGSLRASFGALVETTFSTVTMDAGSSTDGHPVPSAAARTESLAELRVRIPSLASLVRARGASIYVDRSAAPEGRMVTLSSARNLGGLQLVWEQWDLGIEYAGAAPPGQPSFPRPAYVAGFSTHGDPLGAAFGRDAATRTMELGLPLFLEGRGRIKAVRATAALDQPSGTGSWFLQGDAQWRTPTGRVGASAASRRNEGPGSSTRWGWAFSLFQSFRVF